ncbi:hypothetical protein [Clostridium fallax]|uniref:Uncharacterized protein n=1 Tax=Clostridium fallax TaxID=1533 RepID=A0A1M4XJW8_9CLOT|nr:hypothetical protein [Clostridium fallax]SHE93706.1 hypothetical protein SAMN05443638_1194 [Clostridium fallax]SQB06378.1 Uncharacterised protein [Clostridium fallax]
MPEVNRGLIRKILQNRFDEKNNRILEFINVYKHNGVKINMNCCTKVFSNKKNCITKRLCYLELIDKEFNKSLICLSLDENIICINFLDNTKVSYIHLGDVLYEISNFLNKKVLINQWGIPKLYIDMTHIYNLQATEISR